MEISHTELRNNIAKSFSLEEFKSICFEIDDVVFDNLEGSTLVGKIESLIKYLERRGRLDELKKACSIHRPNANWSMVFSTEKKQILPNGISYVKLQLGDMFDGPSDLIVFPCSTAGTITDFVAKRLRQYTIPPPRSGMPLGHVDFLPLDGAENIAQYVAYAVSVDNMTSTITAIQKIGEELGRFTQNKGSIQAISAPLLGAGAGGLRSKFVIEALANGFRKEAISGATLTIHILHQNVFDKLTSEKNQAISQISSSRREPWNSLAPLDHDLGTSGYSVMLPAPRKPLRVFISYSGTSDRQKKWVTELGTFLRSNGMDARLDQWHLRKGMDLPQWMTNELDLAERVIVITDLRYAERADKRLGGIGWETMLIQGNMSELPPDSRKYLVIVREKNFSDGVPRYLKTKFCIHWTDEENENILKDDLLKELYDVELAPPIGTPPIAYIS